MKSAAVKSKDTSSHDLTTVTTPSNPQGHSVSTVAQTSCPFFAHQLCSWVKLWKAAIMDIRYPNITIWSVSSLFFIGPIFICSLGFYMKLHYCGLGCLVMYFFICILCHTIVKMNCCYCEMEFLSNGTTLGDILVFASIVWALWIMYRFKNKSCCWFVHFFPCTLLHLGYSLTHLI